MENTISVLTNDRNGFLYHTWMSNFEMNERYNKENFDVEVYACPEWLDYINDKEAF